MDAGRRALDRLAGWSPVLLLGGLAALTWWLDAQIQPPVARDGSARHDPDVIVERFRAVSFDAEGRPLQRLEAREARHFPDDGMTEFSAPSLTLTEAGRPRFAVTAERGRLTGERDNAYFEGNVKAVRDAETGADGKTTGPITMSTEFLHVMTQEHAASSDRPVTIEEPRGIIHANGFVLNDRDKTFVLKSGVRGTILPEALPK